MSDIGGFLKKVLSQGDRGEDHLKVHVKALAWARVSTDMQEERGCSIPEQLRQIREYAAKNGIEIVEEYHEAASAFTREERRVEFHKMLKRALETPEINAILIHDFSRFSRDSVRAKQLVRELRAKGVKVLSLNDPDIDPETVAGVYMEAITYAKNEAYSREVAFHTRKGCRANLRSRDSETGWCYKNGGLPPLGYRLRHLERGAGRGGRPMVKTVWELDDTIVAGKPIHEHVRHLLAELAAGGASMDQLRDYCNEAGIPARRKQYWSSSTWAYLLRPGSLLQYCGYGVWNVHRKDGTERPASEWEIVENAHPAILTEEEAARIVSARKRTSNPQAFGGSIARTRTSPYLLSGGLFKCERCGSNMTGFRTTGGYTYYVCGSQPYRRGKGCGHAVYVQKQWIEETVLDGLADHVRSLGTPDDLKSLVREELREVTASPGPDRARNAELLKAVDDKIANIRRAVEEGFQDAGWANSRLQELAGERECLLGVSARVNVQPMPRVDEAFAQTCLREAERILAQGDRSTLRKMLPFYVQKIRMAPERRQVEITYRVPEPFVKALVAGALYSPLGQLRPLFVREYRPQRQGRHHFHAALG